MSCGLAAGAGPGGGVVDAVCTGTDGPAEAVRTGAACFGFAVISVLTPRKATGWVAGAAASALELPNKLPIRPAMVVGFSSGASPCFGCGAERGIGTLATVVGALLAGCGRAAGGTTVADGWLDVRGSAPGAVNPFAGGLVLLANSERPLLSMSFRVVSLARKTSFMPPSTPARDGTVDTPSEMYSAILRCSSRR